jgi:hypothetical protein
MQNTLNCKRNKILSKEYKLITRVFTKRLVVYFHRERDLHEAPPVLHACLARRLGLLATTTWKLREVVELIHGSII